MFFSVQTLGHRANGQKTIGSGVTFAMFEKPLHIEITGEELKEPFIITFTVGFNNSKRPCEVVIGGKKENSQLDIFYYNPRENLNLPEQAFCFEILDKYMVSMIFCVDCHKTNFKTYRLTYEIYINDSETA